MAQPKNRRVVTESSAESKFMPIGSFHNDNEVNKVTGIPGTKTRIGLDEGYIPKNEFSGLLPWQAAYAARYQKQARIAIISENEGIGSVAPHHRTRWQRLLELALRDVPGGAGFIPAAYASPLLTDPTTRSGGSATEQLGQFGPGGKYLNLANGATAAWLAETMTSFRLWYVKGDFFSGPGTLKVDGTVVANLTSSNGGAGNIDAVTYPALPAAPLTVTAGSRVISATGADANNQFQIAALEAFNGDESSGVHVYDLSRTALSYSDINDSYWLPSLWNSWLKNIDPHLVIVMLGSTNYGQETDFTEFAMVDVMKKLDTYTSTSCSVLAVLPPRPSKSSIFNPSDWTRYAGRLRFEASLNPERFSFLDLQDYWPYLKPGGATSLGLMNETDYPLNPSAIGHRRISDILRKVLV